MGDVRQCGFIAGIELVKDKATREPYPYGWQAGAQVCQRAREYGVIIRPLADTIVVMPPLVTSMESLDHLMHTVERCIAEVVHGLRQGAGDGLE